MISKADAIVIGSGGLGAATAYYLSSRTRLSVALIDKHDIGSQTSPRAAGMVSCARKSDLMITLIKDACRKIEAFTEETSQPLDWVHSGSLKIARRQEDAEVIKADFERGRRMRLDVELISPEWASRLNPFLKPTGVAAAMRIGDDRYFDPAQVAVGYARAAATRGAVLLPRTDVLAVNITAGRVTGVTTAKGTIESPIVVDAAGAWTRQVAEASGIRVPLVPTRQQLIVTEPLDGVHANLPMVRIMDAACTCAPARAACFGVSTRRPLVFSICNRWGPTSISRTRRSTSRFFVRPLPRSKINSRSCKRLRWENFVAASRR
jgi:glycine/D-amino acid oxidase-like deaminating enzyme